MAQSTEAKVHLGTDSETPKSIRDLAPLETGGTVARKGFIYQDHVAAGICLRLESDGEYLEVWCETHDDVTVIFLDGATERVEFVQVKSNEPDHLWSVADLCKRERAANTSGFKKSILEKSLAQDRATEIASFRIITSRPVNTALKILTLPIGAPARAPGSGPFEQLCTDVKERLPGYKSPNNNDSRYWIERTLWEVKESEKAVENENLRRLSKIAQSMSCYLVEDQLKEVYLKILSRVQAAACAEWAVEPSRKKLKRKEFRSWLQNVIEAAVHPAASGTGKKMREKMEGAGLPEDYIKSADELRLSYRGFVLQPRYQRSPDLLLVQDEIIAILQGLRAKLDAGQIDCSGIEFHASCLAAIEHLRDRVPSEAATALLQGFMYNITDRCLHRFIRLSA